MKFVILQLLLQSSFLIESRPFENGNLAEVSETYEVKTSIGNSSWCGFRDDFYPSLNNTTSQKRKKRYTLQGRKWKKSLLTWALRKLPSNQRNIDNNEVRVTLINAFKLWEDISGLSFQEVNARSANVDIYIDHGDNHRLLY